MLSLRNWIDPRSVLLALLFAVAAACPLIFSIQESREFYFFDVTLTSSNSGFTQLFWDTGRGISEVDSSSQPLKIEPKPVRYRFMMPSGAIKGLRFDLINRHSVMTVAKARIVNRRGKVMHEFSLDDFIASQQIVRFEKQGNVLLVETKPDGNDPVLDLKISTPITLPKDPWGWLEKSGPVAIPAFLIGLILGCPAIVRRLQPRLAALGARMRQRPGAAIAAAAIVAVAWQMHPVIFCGRSFVSPNNGSLMLYGDQPTVPGATQTIWCDGMGSDSGAMLFQHLYYPMVQREALLKHHELPLWNRYCLGGEPLLGQGQSMFGDPFNWITIFSDGASWAWDLRFAIARWLLAAGLGFTVLRATRHLGAAMLVTIGSAFIGFFTFRINHPANFSLCYSPWILWAWLGFIEAATPRKVAAWFAALIAVNGIVMTSGTVKEAYMLMVCLNLAGVAWVLLLPSTAGRRWRLLSIGALSGVVFVLLAAPLLFSFMAALKHSVTGYDFARATPLPLAQFLGFFDEIFYRPNIENDGVLGPSINVLLMLGILTWLIRPEKWRTDRGGLAVFLAALVPLSLGFGIVPPAVIVKIPFLGNIVHVGATFSCPLIVLTAVLAGFGFRNAIERLSVREGWWDFARMLLLAAALAAIYFFASRSHAKTPFFQGYVFALGAVVVLLPLGARWAARSSRPGLLYIALVLGLPVLLWRFGQYTSIRFNHYAWSPGERVNVHAQSPAVDFVDQLRREPERIIGLQHTVFPVYNTALHWESLYGVDALRSWYYHNLASVFKLERVWQWDHPAPEETVPMQLHAYDLFNVKHYVTDRADPPREIAGLRFLASRDLNIYESPTVWPRAFFTDRMTTYANLEEFGQMIQTGDGRPLAAVDRAEMMPQIPVDLAGRLIRTASNWKLTTNTTSFTIEANGPGVVVLSETYYPEDFRVTVNGKPTTYFRVNFAFKGVAIEKAGRYEITFAYWPQHFTFALWLCAAGAVLFAASAWWLARNRKM